MPETRSSNILADALAENGGSATVDALKTATGLSERQIRYALGKMTGLGAVVEQGAGPACGR